MKTQTDRRHNLKHAMLLGSALIICFLAETGWASEYKPMVQFRNIVVHRYETVDSEIVIGILKRHLDDFEKFVSEVRGYAQSES